MSRKPRVAIYMRLSKGDHAARGGLQENGVLRKEIHSRGIADKRVSAGKDYKTEAPDEDVFCDEESNSIRMQRSLLKQYVETHFKDCELLEFEDDGYSGTSFNRPAVIRLLKMVRNMEIDCIVVKDFSRFSRDYIELGAYMEQIFPFMGVRFISVNDGYDSAVKRYASGELDISFKNLLYDLYSKDLSVKVRSALAVRKQKGQYISANSPFGYVKSAEDRHMLLIEEGEAQVVRRIFALALQGRSSADIAKLLNGEGVKTPLQFRAERGETGRIPKQGIFIWQSSTVCQILRNRVYVGDIVYGKTQKESVGGKNRLKPRSEWKVYANHHAPIIDRKTFCMLQERRGAVRSAKPDLSGKEPEKERHPLSGRLVCGCCGRNLYLRRMSAPYFACPYRYVSSRGGCVEKADASALEQHVLSQIQLHVLKMEGAENLKNRCRETAEKRREELRKKKRRLQREESLFKRKKSEAYEAYSLYRISRNEEIPGGSASGAVRTTTESSVGAADFLRTRLAEIDKQIMTVKAGIAETEEKLSLLGKDQMDCLGLTKLTEQNVSALIKKLVVYADGKSEIHWVEWERVTLFRQLCDTGGN